ncbi:hypothetical protein HUU62_15790 [Rhodoferax sp. 4810]|nr:hypothetical protein [Rhodoferax jenense]
MSIKDVINHPEMIAIFIRHLPSFLLQNTKIISCVMKHHGAAYNHTAADTAKKSHDKQ